MCLLCNMLNVFGQATHNFPELHTMPLRRIRRILPNLSKPKQISNLSSSVNRGYLENMENIWDLAAPRAHVSCAGRYQKHQMVHYGINYNPDNILHVGRALTPSRCFALCSAAIKTRFSSKGKIGAGWTLAKQKYSQEQTTEGKRHARRSTSRRTVPRSAGCKRLCCAQVPSALVATEAQRYNHGNQC